MLVYAVNLMLEPKDGVGRVLDCVARWLGKRSNGFVDPKTLLSNATFRLNDGSTVRTTSASDDVDSRPFLCSVTLSHPDAAVSGRQWVVEIGLRQETATEAIHCSVLVETNEVSSRVTSPVQATRPGIVVELVKSCSPIPLTPSLSVRTLTVDNAAGFTVALDHVSREVPWVVVSPTREATYLVDPQRLRSQLVGIAEVFEIPVGADTFEIQRLTGAGRSSWLGATRIIFPKRTRGISERTETVLLRAEELDDTAEDGLPAWSKVLAAVTHRTNLPNSWKHISPSVVNTARLNRQIASAIGHARESGDKTEYVLLLEAADKELSEQKETIENLRTDLSDFGDRLLEIEAECDSLRHSLSGKQSSHADGNLPIGLEALRVDIISAIHSHPHLSSAINIIGALFPDRIVFLQTASSSAMESNSFKYNAKAFDLIAKLATSYWEILSEGGADAQARAVFGNAYSAKEAETLSTNGVARRTFVYKGKSVEMMKHLKIGVKDSAAETLRIHFEWFADEKRIVVGHCGPHLNF